MENLNDKWSKLLKSKEYNYNAFKTAVQWMDDALGFIRDAAFIPLAEIKRRSKELIERVEKL